RPGSVLGSGPTIAGLADWQGAAQAEAPRAAVLRLSADIQAFRTAHQLDRVVVAHVASTEPPFELNEAHVRLDALRGALDGPGVLPASSLYALAALELGCPYVNFTPSLGASLPALLELAAERRVAISGKDGKTGETLMKTVLAPMFAHRNLRVLSWVGHNI